MHILRGAAFYKQGSSVSLKKKKTASSLNKGSFMVPNTDRITRFNIPPGGRASLIGAFYYRDQLKEARKKSIYEKSFPPSSLHANCFTVISKVSKSPFNVPLQHRDKSFAFVSPKGWEGGGETFSFRVESLMPRHESDLSGNSEFTLAPGRENRLTRPSPRYQKHRRRERSVRERRHVR